MSPAGAVPTRSLPSTCPNGDRNRSSQAVVAMGMNDQERLTLIPVQLPHLSSLQHRTFFLAPTI